MILLIFHTAMTSTLIKSKILLISGLNLQTQLFDTILKNALYKISMSVCACKPQSLEKDFSWFQHGWVQHGWKWSGESGSISNLFICHHLTSPRSNLATINNPPFKRPADDGQQQGKRWIHGTSLNRRPSPFQIITPPPHPPAPALLKFSICPFIGLGLWKNRNTCRWGRGIVTFCHLREESCNLFGDRGGESHSCNNTDIKAVHHLLFRHYQLQMPFCWEELWIITVRVTQWDK